jgi:hypothetical protein
VPIADLGARHSGFRGALGGSDGWVLLDGNDPASSGWVLALEVLLLLFVAWNVGALIRVTRRVRDA